MQSLLLLDALYRFRVLKKLLRVVIQNNGPIIIQSVVVATLLCFIFSVFGFWLFETDYANPDTGEYYCDTLWRCFIRHLLDGNRQGGGVADLMQEPPFGTLHFYSRQLFDMLFYLIMIVIITAIASGIIIDAFGAIRDEESNALEDMKSRCFICGLENGIFERHGQGFQKHILEDHNMWSYLFFMIHLQQTDPSNYTAQEAYVDEMVTQQNNPFFFFFALFFVCVLRSELNSFAVEREEHELLPHWTGHGCGQQA
jgi:hypothetical protein